MQHLRFLVERATDAVPQNSRTTEAVAPRRISGSPVADVAEPRAGLDLDDARHMASKVTWHSRRLAAIAGVADHEHAAVVAVPAVLDDGDVDVDDVAVLQRAVVGMPWQTWWLTEVQSDAG